MAKTTKIVLLLAMVGMGVACQKTAPQRPTTYARSEKTAEVDSATLRLMHFNQRMADAADAELATLVRRDTAYSWTQREFGVWQRQDGLHAEETIGPDNGEEVRIHMVIQRLDGSLIIDTEQQHTVGDNRLPVGIESALREMEKNETRHLAIPWYSGYGVQGNDIVNKYENILVEITLL